METIEPQEIRLSFIGPCTHPGRITYCPPPPMTATSSSSSTTLRNASPSPYFRTPRGCRRLSSPDPFRSLRPASMAHDRPLSWRTDRSRQRRKRGRHDLLFRLRRRRRLEDDERRNYMGPDLRLAA